MASTNKKILLIEDEKMITDLLCSEFEAAGYDVAQAKDGEEGLSLIASFEPDIVVLDLVLPKKTGYQVVQELHDQGRIATLPVLVLSNSAGSRDVDLLLNLGVREVLTKVNFNPTDVVEKIGILSAVDDFMQKNQAIDQEKNAEKSDFREEVGIDDTGGKKICVLIIEDDPFIGDILLNGLMEHFTSYKVINTTEADEVFLKHNIDALILDVMLPGKDGITYLKELRRRPECKDLIVILASNLGQKEEVKRGMDAGADDYIIKANYLPEEIAQRVQTLIRERS